MKGLKLSGLTMQQLSQRGILNMALYEVKKVDFEHTDDRGRLTQLVHKGYQQINVVETRKGVVRGGHYHKVSSEAFFVVSGSVEVTLKDDFKEETVVFSKGKFFELHSFIVHSMFFPEDCILVAMYDIPVEKTNGVKDIYSEEVEI